MKSRRVFLDALAKKYSDRNYLTSDPIDFCYRYETKEDIEIIGFIAALFSYGNVISIKKHLEELFGLLGKSPFAYIKQGNFISIESKIPKYRFQTSKDIFVFLKTLSLILNEYDTLEALFFLSSPTDHLNNRIVNFQNFFLDRARLLTKKKKLSSGLTFLIGSGILGSSHKRYCMFLRWMVRDTFPDFGLYKSISKADLIYPTDVHIVRLSSILGFSNRRTVDFKLALGISKEFRAFNPEDPLAYDFALSRLGILKVCKVKYVADICETCDLKSICSIYAVKK